MRQLISLILPVTVVLIIPFFLVARLRPFALKSQPSLPVVQLPLGALLLCGGFALLYVTVRLFARKGRGTLAPWDPPRKLVTDGVYRYVRNPMITGVLFMLIGEAILLGSWSLLVWAVLFALTNTTYFRFFEEPGLARRFGDGYLLYRNNVPMWLPRLRPWSESSPSSAKRDKPSSGGCDPGDHDQKGRN